MGKQDDSSLGRRQILVSTSLPTEALSAGRGERLRSCLQSVQRALSLSFSCAVWDLCLSGLFGDVVAFESFLSGTPHHAPVRNSKLDFDAIVTLVCVGSLSGATLGCVWTSLLHNSKVNGDIVPTDASRTWELGQQLTPYAGGNPSNTPVQRDSWDSESYC